jgi:hypothetical protein
MKWSQWLGSCGVSVFTPQELAALKPEDDVPGVVGLDMRYPSPPGLAAVGGRHFDMILVASETWKKIVAPLCRCPVRVLRAPRTTDPAPTPDPRVGHEVRVLFANVDDNDDAGRYDVYAMGIARFLIRNSDAPALFSGKPGIFDAVDILRRELERFGLRGPRMQEALAKVLVQPAAWRTADVGVTVAEARGAGDALLDFAASGRPVIATAAGCARDLEGLALVVPGVSEIYKPDEGRALIANPDDLCAAFETMMLAETRQRYGRSAKSAAFRSENRARMELDALIELAEAHRNLHGVE